MVCTNQRLEGILQSLFKLLVFGFDSFLLADQLGHLLFNPELIRVVDVAARMQSEP